MLIYCIYANLFKGTEDFGLYNILRGYNCHLLRRLGHILGGKHLARWYFVLVSLAHGTAWCHMIDLDSH